ncbi:MAG: 50S ribosomal protein L21 [Clostridia bacterium]|nr:50S ribosomal protein L21 [Clostridia bacterium]MDE6211046.1 50S ribosomal protein L21 [Clostridia bacterium]MDE6362293.1 50S ribosomal protein L21 [Clostridia bacterium]MDE6605440.1 50S ribosomal protein L21 [Clostridia bacterium]MDE6869520.1 50S ribosomal protein L21 [Clostridia bacterium]
MYAIVLTGGKQYKVAKDEIIKVEKIDKEIGAKVELDVVMLNNDGKIACGKEVENSKVVAEVVAQDKAKKIVVFKYKSKKNERKRQGHRQPFTALKIAEIKA